MTSIQRSDRDQLVFATLVSTGVAPFWTRPGVFQIRIKKPAEKMTKAYTPGDPDFYYIEDVPWTMYFDEDRALHGAYWHNFFGYERSHGCVNLSISAARWVFRWTLPTVPTSEVDVFEDDGTGVDVI